MERGLGVEVQFAGEIDHGEKQITEFILDGGDGRKKIGGRGGERGAQLGDFLVELGKDRLDIRPVEADAGGLLLRLLRVQERGQTARQAVERARRRVAFFRALDFLPALKHGGAVGAVVGGKNVRMPAHELGRDFARDIVESEAPLFGGELRVKDRLEQQVAEFLAEVGVVAVVDRGDDLVRLLQQRRAQRSVGLLAIPRAAAGSAQLGHDVGELVDAGEVGIGRAEGWRGFGGHGGGFLI